MPTPAPALSRRLVLLMAVACGVGVANVYFPQAITPLIATDLGVSEGSAAVVATVVQLGYAAGIFFLVPLGDRLSRRPLISGMVGVVAVGLVLAGLMPSLTGLLGLSVVVGAATVVPQMLIPMAADLAADDVSGRAVGMLQGGLVGGILVARAFGGLLGDWFGWRGPYLVAGALAAVLAVALAVALPSTRSSTRHRYPALLATGVRLFRTETDLRRSCFYQFFVYGAFSAAWTTVALLLTGPTYGYGTDVVGVVALVGAATVVAVPMAGRRIDRSGPEPVTLACLLGLAGSAALLLTGSLAGALGLAGLVAGLLVLDLAVQSGQVANQARIFALDAGARSRLNSVYMTSVFTGGTVGSWVGTRVYLRVGWPGVCALVVVAAAATLARHAVHAKAVRAA